MLKSYFRTALRFLLKNKTFSLINIIGLAVGTLSCIYIVLYVEDQYSYDHHQDHASDLYRITTTLKLSGESHKNASSSPPIAAAMKHDFGEVREYTRVFDAGIFGADQSLLKYKDKAFNEKKIAFVDSTFFHLFTYHFLRGNPSRALDEPFSIVLSQTMALRFFGGEDPIGKVIQIDNKAGKEDLKVTGVVDESLGKSHVTADVFITMNSGLIGNLVRKDDSWAGSNYIYSYVKLAPGANPHDLEKKLPAFLDHYGLQQMKAVGMEKQLTLQPVSAIHTDTTYESELGRPISHTFLNLLLAVALLIQAIACINFMNLSTARASRRAKEVGVRKVIGAGRADLIRQFLGESILLTLGAVLLALPILMASLPYLNQITGADIQLSSLHDYRIWLILLALGAGTGMLAGSYPAFYLSAFQPVRVIKGDLISHISAAGLRRTLVVFQFVLSIVLISSIVIIYSQLNYIKHKDLGFEKDQKLVFNVYTGGVNIARIMDDFRLLPEVKAATRSNSQLGKRILGDDIVYPAGGNMTSGQDVMIMQSDRYFSQAAGIRIVGGRDFREGDSGRVLINETLAKKLRIDPAAAEGVKLYSKRGDGKVITHEIAGVMKDFHFSSLRETLQPLMLTCDPNRPSLCDVMVNCNAGDYKTLLSKMQSIWQKDAPGVPFEYSFLDDTVQRQYETEITLSNIINSFTGMAILISCLGLFGLAAFSAEQRSKEIGIRKILGASVYGIVQLFSKDFLKLVVISIAIATPIAWWAMSKWLQAFAYRITISWWMFAVAGLIAVVIALGTVSFQAIRAALANPVKSLRTE